MLTENIVSLHNMRNMYFIYIFCVKRTTVDSFWEIINYTFCEVSLAKWEEKPEKQLNVHFIALSSRGRRNCWFSDFNICYCIPTNPPVLGWFPYSVTSLVLISYICLKRAQTTLLFKILLLGVHHSSVELHWRWYKSKVLLQHELSCLR